MTTVNVNSTLYGKPLRLGANSDGYSLKRLLIQNVAIPAPTTAVGKITIGNSGSNYSGIPTVGFSGGNGSGAAGFATMLADAASALDAGTGYQPGDTITLTGGNYSSPAELTVASVQLVSISLTSGGTGYIVGETLFLDGGTNTGLVAITVTAINDGGGGTGPITSFTIISGGNFTATGALTVYDQTGSGSGATFSGPLFGLNTLTVTDGGNYTALPLNPVSQGSTSGDGEFGTATVTYGVNSVVMTNSGSGYTLAPSVSFTAGGGGGATATAALSGDGAALAVTLDFQPDLPTTNYSVRGMASTPCAISCINKTVDKASLVLTPPLDEALAAGTLDAIVEYVD